MRSITLIILFVLARAESSDTEIFKVYRIFLKNWNDVENVASLRTIIPDLDFWTDSGNPGHFSDVMISSHFESIFLQYIEKFQLDIRLNIANVQTYMFYSISPFHRLINAERHKIFEDKDNEKDNRAFDEPLLPDERILKRSFEKIRETRANFTFGRYNSYGEMVRFMRNIEFYYPHLARLIRIGTSHEGRPIEGLKIGFPVANSTKPAFWIDGNIHAREWASSHTAVFIINQLIAGYGVDPEVTHYLNNINFYIVPSVNPDGYVYSMSSASPQIRLWRKNRSPEKCIESAWGGIRCCRGVDLNRNFDFHWGETGASTNPCSNLYGGEAAFSEPETRAVREFLSSKNLRGNLKVFISLHTYAQMIIHPFSHEPDVYPSDVERIKEVGERAAKRLKSVYGTEYRVGTGANLLSPAAGGSDDWAKEKLRIRYVFLIELRPDNDYRNGFILNQDELIPTAIETFEALKEIMNAVLEDNSVPLPPRESYQSEAQSKEDEVKNLFVGRSINVAESPFASMNSATSTMTPTTRSPPKTMSSTVPSLILLPKTSTITWKLTTSIPISDAIFKTSTSAVISNPTPKPTQPPTLTSTSTEKPIPFVSELLTSTVFETTPSESALSSPVDRKSTKELETSAHVESTTTEPITLAQLTEPTIQKSRRFGPRFLTASSSKSSKNSSLPRIPPLIVNRPNNIAPIISSSRRIPTTSCSDRKYSCIFWINAEPKACIDQKNFMSTNCAFSCGFCPH